MHIHSLFPTQPPVSKAAGFRDVRNSSGRRVLTFGRFVHGFPDPSPPCTTVDSLKEVWGLYIEIALGVLGLECRVHTKISA